MFCPNCGKAEQTVNTYCRGCGEFLLDSTNKTRLVFGGNTAEDQINVNLFLNFLSGCVSFILAVLLYITFWGRGETLPIIYIVAGFLLAMCGWQFSSFRVGIKLKKTFAERKSIVQNTAELNENRFQTAETKDLLSEADFSNVVPASVTENTTKHLVDKIKKSSS